ncbi:DUF4012 domain-containing protein [Microbacterium sp. GXF7504]
MTASPPLRSPLSRRARRAGVVVIWVLVAVLVLVLAATAWIGVRGAMAAGHLRDAQREASSLMSSLGDPASAAAGVGRVAEETAAARALTGDPVWSAAMRLPWVGDQLGAVRTAVAAVDDVVGEALSPLAASASGFSLSSLKPEGGRFDLDALASLHDPAATAAAGTAEAAATVATIPTERLLAPLADQVVQVRELIGTAASATGALSRATELMPSILGADRPRDYLVLFQNNAEWRSLGGIVGATAMVHTDAGAIALAAQASSSDFPETDTSVVPLSDELIAVYEQKPGRYIQNVTQVPSFPLTAQLAQTMWANERGVWADGVLSLDPVALSYLLRATGPVTLVTGEDLTSENALQLLLNDVYLRYEDPREQDAFFQAAAAAVFEALADGRADITQLVAALAQAGSEDRVLVWSADPAEQAVLDGTTLQGALPVTDAEQTTFGVYLNDGTGSKMDYYMHVDVGTAWCTDTEGDPDAALTVTLRSDAPADAADLPRYITGGGAFGVAAGVTRTVAYLYLPVGSEVVFAMSQGSSDFPGFGTGTHDGRPVLIWTTDLAPGAEATARIRVRTPATPVLGAATTPVLPDNAGSITASCSTPS